VAYHTVADGDVDLMDGDGLFLHNYWKVMVLTLRVPPAVSGSSVVLTRYHCW
jgi:hypothetical protein